MGDNEKMDIDCVLLEPSINTIVISDSEKTSDEEISDDDAHYYQPPKKIQRANEDHYHIMDISFERRSVYDLLGKKIIKVLEDGLNEGLPEKVFSFVVLNEHWDHVSLRGFSTKSTEPDYEEFPPEGSETAARQGNACFNCNSTNHTLRRCPYPFDRARVMRAKQEFLKSKVQKPDRRFAHIKPGGTFSNELKEALDLEEGQIPPILYRMRELKYPPGWLLEAREAMKSKTTEGADNASELNKEGEQHMDEEQHKDGEQRKDGEENMDVEQHKDEEENKDGEQNKNGEQQKEGEQKQDGEQIKDGADQVPATENDAIEMIQFPGFNADPGSEPKDQTEEQNAPVFDVEKEKIAYENYLKNAKVKIGEEIVELDNSKHSYVDVNAVPRSPVRNEVIEINSDSEEDAPGRRKQMQRNSRQRSNATNWTANKSNSGQYMHAHGRDSSNDDSNKSKPTQSSTSTQENFDYDPSNVFQVFSNENSAQSAAAPPANNARNNFNRNRNQQTNPFKSVDSNRNATNRNNRQRAEPVDSSTSTQKQQDYDLSTVFQVFDSNSTSNYGNKTQNSQQQQNDIDLSNVFQVFDNSSGTTANNNSQNRGDHNNAFNSNTGNRQQQQQQKRGRQQRNNDNFANRLQQSKPDSSTTPQNKDFDPSTVFQVFSSNTSGNQQSKTPRADSNRDNVSSTNKPNASNKDFDPSTVFQVFASDSTTSNAADNFKSNSSSKPTSSTQNNPFRRGSQPTRQAQNTNFDPSNVFQVFESNANQDQTTQNQDQTTATATAPKAANILDNADFDPSGVFQVFDSTPSSTTNQQDNRNKSANKRNQRNQHLKSPQKSNTEQKQQQQPTQSKLPGPDFDPTNVFQVFDAAPAATGPTAEKNSNAAAQEKSSFDPGQVFQVFTADQGGTNKPDAGNSQLQRDNNKRTHSNRSSNQPAAKTTKPTQDVNKDIDYSNAFKVFDNEPSAGTISVTNKEQTNEIQNKPSKDFDPSTVFQVFDNNTSKAATAETTQSKQTNSKPAQETQSQDVDPSQVFKVFDN